jgi:hypothetical protein
VNQKYACDYMKMFGQDQFHAYPHASNQMEGGIVVCELLLNSILRVTFILLQLNLSIFEVIVHYYQFQDKNESY